MHWAAEQNRQLACLTPEVSLSTPSMEEKTSPAKKTVGIWLTPQELFTFH